MSLHFLQGSRLLPRNQLVVVDLGKLSELLADVCLLLLELLGSVGDALLVVPLLGQDTLQQVFPILANFDSGRLYEACCAGLGRLDSLLSHSILLESFKAHLLDLSQVAVLLPLNLFAQRHALALILSPQLGNLDTALRLDLVDLVLLLVAYLLDGLLGFAVGLLYDLSDALVGAADLLAGLRQLMLEATLLTLLLLHVVTEPLS